MKVLVQSVFLFVSLSVVSCQEQCLQNRFDQDPFLNSCFMESTNNTAEAFDNFCRMGNCSRLVAQAFEDCGRPGEAERFRTVCIQDAMGRFCMSVMVDSELITPAARACAGTDCNNANCRVAIDELGCCIAVSNLADFSDLLPIEQCNVRPCNTVGDTTTPSNSAGHSGYSIVIVFTATLTLLHFAQI